MRSISRPILTAVLMAAAVLGPARAQQQRTETVDQGRPNAGAPWFAALYLGGAPVSAGNPFPVTVGNGFALDASLTARLGTLGQKPSAGSTPVAPASDYVPPLPPNAATAGNQARNLYAAPVVLASADVNGFVVGSVLQQGASPSLYPWFNATFRCSQAATAHIQGSLDGTTFYEILTQPLTANTPFIGRVPTTGWPYMRAYLQNGATAAAAGSDGLAAIVASSLSGD